MHVAVDGAEGVADFVRDACREPADARQLFGANEVRALFEQTVCHSIHAGREVHHLDRLAGGEPPRQVAGSNGLGGAHGFAQRAQNDLVDLVRDVAHENADVGRDEDADVQRRMARLDDVVENDDNRDSENERGRDEQREVEQQLGTERVEAAQDGGSRCFYD